MLPKELQVAKISIYNETNAENNPNSQENKVWLVEIAKKDVTNDLLKDYTFSGSMGQTSFPVNASRCETDNLFQSKQFNKTKSRVKFGEAAPSVICRVKRMQEMTHILALIFFAPGLVLLAATPCMVIPIFVFPSGNKSLFVTLMLVEWFVALVLIAIGTIVTNLHWYYDPKVERMRCTLRCCNWKKTFRFWGSSSFSYQPLDDVI